MVFGLGETVQKMFVSSCSIKFHYDTESTCRFPLDISLFRSTRANYPNFPRRKERLYVNYEFWNDSFNFRDIFTFCSGTTFWLGSRRATRRRPRRFGLPRLDTSDSETFAPGKRVGHGWTRFAFFWASCRLEGRCSFRTTCQKSLPPEMARVLAEDFPIWCTGCFQGRSCPQSPSERPNRPRNLLETQIRSQSHSTNRQLLGDEIRYNFEFVPHSPKINLIIRTMLGNPSLIGLVALNDLN